MNKVEFSKIMAALEDHKSSCQKYLKDIHTTEDLKALTLKQAAALQSFCRSEQAFMDKVCNSDIYHIIGLGNLTPPQMVQFTFALREWLTYRPVLKALAMNFERISKLPAIPLAGTYKLSLGDVTVGYREYTSWTGDCTNPPFSISDDHIFVNTQRLNEFVAIMQGILSYGLSEATCRSKIAGGHEYIGIQWTAGEGDHAIGTFKSEDIKKRITQYFENLVKVQEK